MAELEQYSTTIIGGGTAPVSISDGALERTPNVTDICTVTDFGGDTRDKRLKLSESNEKFVSGVGDVSRRMAVHVRNNADIRNLFIERHSTGTRAGNDMVAAAQLIKGGDLYAGVKMLEHGFRADYVGRVIPISNQNLHLRAHFEDQEPLIGEDKIDKIRSPKPHIVGVDFVREVEINSGRYEKVEPVVLDDALESIEDTDVVTVAPGSFWTSIRAVTDMQGVPDAMRRSRGQLEWFCNVVDFLEKPASWYAKQLTELIGRKFDIAVVNVPNFDLPQSYADEGLDFVRADIEECYKYAEMVIAVPIAQVYTINGLPTIRHISDASADLIDLAAKRAKRRIIYPSVAS